MKDTNNILDQFILQATLIDPIQSIVDKLKNKEFRDCDLKWLDNKLNTFVNIAATTLDINTSTIKQPDSVKPKYMNNYATEYYINYFTKLLNYFKSI